MELNAMLSAEPYDFDSYIEKLNKELMEKEAEIEKAKERIAELLAARIYTRAELKQINEEKIKREKEKEEYEKNNIDLITKQSLNIAKNMRESAAGLSEEEKKEIEIAALNLEKRALEKEIKIKRDILKEKESEMNRILADKVFCESKIKKLKRNMNKNNSSENKVKIETLRNYSKNNNRKYFEFLKQNEILKDGMMKSQSRVIFLNKKLNLDAHK